MAMIKEQRTTRSAQQVRVERLVWVLIYGGLLMLVLGWFSQTTQEVDATVLYVLGAAAVVAGVILVFVRARMRGERK